VSAVDVAVGEGHNTGDGGLSTMANKALGCACRLPFVALAALGCAVVIAACGSTKSSVKAASNQSAQLLTFSDCMRSHGVPSFPDPSGGGIHFGPGSGIDPSSPAFKAAQSACRRLLPGGGPGNQHPTAQEIDMARQISECMRQHAVTGFPDPTFTPPSSSAGHSLVLDLNGVVLDLPSSINPSSPVFVHAAKVCHFPLPGA
jgi:hypothetical protein